MSQRADSSVPTDKTNPFAEAGDDDKTVVVARGSVKPQPAPREPEPPVEPDAVPTRLFKDLPVVGDTPVLSAAAPLLSLLARLRNVATVPDPASLRNRAIAEVRRYEEALRNSKLPLDLIRASHYAICASLDDVVQNTPWGSRGPWADASLVSTFHQEVRSGERFFELLTRLCQTPGKFLPAIELMYLCISLGMQGRYRISGRGSSDLDRVREETYLVILRQRGKAEPALSLHWRGVSAPWRPLRFELPVWLAALVAFALLCLVYILILFGLNGASDRLFASSLGLPPTNMPAISRDAPVKPVAPAPQPQSSAKSHLTGLLQPEIASGAVKMAGTPTRPIIRLQSAGMFASGSAVVERRFLPVLARVAAALEPQKGKIRIVGFTDNSPIHTVAFPSNYELSLARAKAAGAALGSKIDPGRISAEGRADADPIDTNDTPQGRQQNRRIEIEAEGPQP